MRAKIFFWRLHTNGSKNKNQTWYSLVIINAWHLLHIQSLSLRRVTLLDCAHSKTVMSAACRKLPFTNPKKVTFHCILTRTSVCVCALSVCTYTTTADILVQQNCVVCIQMKRAVRVSLSLREQREREHKEESERERVY